MQADFSFLDIVFLVAMALFIITRFKSRDLPKEDKKIKPRNVVNFPDMKTSIEPADKSTKKQITSKKKESELTGLDKIMALDKNFRKKDFLAGAEVAYKMYYDALDGKDEETLEGILAPRKFDEVMEEIESLEEKGEKRYISIEDIKKVEILEARLHGRTAIIDVKYTALKKDKIAKEGNKKALDKVKEKEVSTVWAWAKSVDSEDLNWELESISLLS